MTSIEKNLRTARVLHIALLVMVAVAFDVSYRLLPPIQSQASPILVYVVIFCCLNDIAVAGVLRSRMITPSRELLRSSPNDESALKKWQAGVFVSLVMAYTVVVFGLALRFYGATWNVASWFFILGFLLLLAWTPRLDVRADG